MQSKTWPQELLAMASPEAPIDIPDVASTVIAALALIVSVWTIVWTRKNDKRAVKPKVEIYQHFWGNVAELQISNIGLGPARIDQIEYRVDGKPASGLNEALTLAGLGEPFERKLVLRHFGPGYMLANNSNQPIVEIDATTLKNGENFKAYSSELVEALKKIQIKVTYSSIHEETETIEWHFDRHTG